MCTFKVLDLPTIAKKLQDRNLAYVSRITGISAPTLMKLAKGDVNSKYHEGVILAISNYLSEF